MIRSPILICLLLVVILPSAAIGVGPTRTEGYRSRLPAKSAAAIYFVPFGDIRSLSLEQLVTFYRQKFQLTIKILPGLQLERAAVDLKRNQLIAEELIELMKRAHPRLSSNRRVIMIGITEDDMYIRKFTWQFGFSYRAENRFAVISSARMNPVNLGRPNDQALLQTRVRKMITKNIGILYFHLPQNNNPRSVLYRSILGIDDLDRVGEDF